MSVRRAIPAHPVESSWPLFPGFSGTKLPSGSRVFPDSWGRTEGQIMNWQEAGRLAEAAQYGADPENYREPPPGEASVAVSVVETPTRYVVTFQPACWRSRAHRGRSSP